MPSKPQVTTDSNKRCASGTGLFATMIGRIAVILTFVAVGINIFLPLYNGGEQGDMFSSFFTPNLSPRSPVTAAVKNNPLVVVAAAAAAVTSSTTSTASTISPSQHHHHVLMDLSHSVTMIKPVLVEVGVLLLCQAVGVPLLSKFGGVARKLVMSSSARWTATAAASSTRVRLPMAATRHLRVLQKGTLRSWKSMVALYSKTGASKIVNRAKKLIKVFMHHEEENEDETNKQRHVHSVAARH